MNPTEPRDRSKIIEEMPDDDAFQHEWAEFNLPATLLRGLSRDEDDALAFVGLLPELDTDWPDATS